MKQVFIVWNYIMIAVAVVNLIIVGAAVLSGASTNDGALVFFSGLLAVIPAIFTIIMAKAGIRGEYSTCRKLALIVLALSIFGIISGGKSAILPAVTAGIYFFMVISLDKYKY